MEKTEILKVIPLITPLINSLCDSLLKPKLNELSINLNLKKNIIDQQFENKFKEYLVRSYEKYSIMNTIVFHNQQKFLKDLYVPLTVKNSNNEKFIIDNFDYNFLPKYQRILITDTAGMGKSTIVKRIFLSIIEDTSGIPILIELRRLSKTRDIIDEIRNQINSLNKEIKNDFILHLIQKGDFIFLFDGFDEIPENERSFVTEQIQTFVNKASNCQFLLTSRPENALVAFGDFQEFIIEPLKLKEAYSLIKKYDNDGELSKQLLKKIQSRTYNNIQEFLINPLLVSLLYTAFEHKNIIPIKKYIFYRQVYDALFESHDLTKGDSFIREKFSKLDIDEFHKVLRHIGYNCIIKSKIEFTKDEILEIIKEARQFIGNLTFKDSEFLKDLINTVPLFIIDGIYYKWSHKSLQEYFAAQFIYVDSKEIQSEILLKLAFHDESERFINILDLYYSIDYKTFSEVIINNLLESFFEHLKKSYTSFENKSKYERQLLTFAYEYIIIKKEFGKLGSDEAWDTIKSILKNDEADKGWSILMAPVPEQEKVSFLKVYVRATPKTTLLKFLNSKNEKIVGIYQKSKNFTDIKINIAKDKPYFISDKKNAILNNENNFELINKLILQYYGDNFYFINETEGEKYMKLLNDKKGTDCNEKLLNF